MNPLEIKVLSYINKNTYVSKTDIEKHFKRFESIAINGVLYSLEVQYDFIREKDNTSYIITDRGQIEAINHILTTEETRQERIIGFVFGIISGVAISLITAILIG